MPKALSQPLSEDAAGLPEIPAEPEVNAPAPAPEVPADASVPAVKSKDNTAIEPASVLLKGTAAVPGTVTYKSADGQTEVTVTTN